MSDSNYAAIRHSGRISLGLCPIYEQATKIKIILCYKGYLRFVLQKQGTTSPKDQ
jgi:hypothetical protein